MGMCSRCYILRHPIKQKGTIMQKSVADLKADSSFSKQPLNFHFRKGENGEHDGSLIANAGGNIVYCVAKQPRYTPDDIWGSDCKLIIHYDKHFQMLLNTLEQICEKAEHYIPFYAYGDSESGVALSNIIDEIKELASSASIAASKVEA